MSKVIFDSSAFLTLINNEPGKDILEPLLHVSIISSLAIADIVTELNNQLSIPEDKISKILSLISEVYPFDKQSALKTALLEQQYPTLSLEERSALILAKQLNFPLYTAKTSLGLLTTQNHLDLLNIQIITIR